MKKLMTTMTAAALRATGVVVLMVFATMTAWAQGEPVEGSVEYVVRTWDATAGRMTTTRTVEPGVYYFEMPTDGMNVTVTATFPRKARNNAPITYIDANGEEQTTDIGCIFILDGSESVLGHDGAEMWYVCNTAATANNGKGLVYDHKLTLDGPVHIILADGSKMSVTPDEEIFAIYSGGYPLTIYRQVGETEGQLIVEGSTAGFEIEGTALTINGGQVNGTGFTGIYAKDVIINGGIVTATGEGEYAFGINGNSPNDGGHVTINGGQVTATGFIGISGSTDITLGWRKPGDYIKATNYASEDVKIVDGKILKYGSNGTKLMGTLDAATLHAISAIENLADKALTPYGVGGYCGVTSVNGGQNVVWEILAADDPATTDIDESKMLVIKKNPDVTGQTNFSMADYDNNNTGNFAPWITPDNDGTSSAGLKYPVTSVVIADGVTYVGQKAFDNCRGLSTVTIGNDVTTIGQQAFYLCVDLTSVTIGSKVESFAPGAFMYCGLTTVTIPASVTNIEDNAFVDCHNLATVTIYAPSLIDYGYQAFDGNADGRKIYVFSDCVETYKGAAKWSSYAGDILPITLTANPGDKSGEYWTTYYNELANAKVPEGAQAFKVTLTGTTLELTEIEDGIITKGTGVVIKSTSDSVLPEYSASGSSDTGDNNLKGTMTRITNPNYGKVYVLNKMSAGIGFYKLRETGTIAAHKAYLVYDSTTAPEFFGLDGDATGIETKRPTPSLNGGEWYDLSGRKLDAKPTAKGLYINGGRKVVIK